MGNRGLATGAIYSKDGKHLAYRYPRNLAANEFRT